MQKVLITDVVKDGGFATYGLALVGLPALVTGGPRPLGRELQILFLLAVSVVAIGAATGSYGLARAIPVASSAHPGPTCPRPPGSCASAGAKAPRPPLRSLLFALIVPDIPAGPGDLAARYA
ncbi:MAG: hypothetical protein JWO67_634 [Streptosporangiaceae bacterium]|nr:hypothetical protein [Streptosporangiaceae bacterium]